MELFRLMANLERNDNLHLSRILVLLGAFVDPNEGTTISGITKLAKLDFLLRYPTFLERALVFKELSTKKVDIKNHEKTNVESSMVRFKYGPWDFRYRRFINILIAKGLVFIKTKGRTIEIGLTEEGIQLSRKLSISGQFDDITSRSQILKQHFDYTATNLMKYIYKTFPEISSLRWGEEINQ